MAEEPQGDRGDSLSPPDNTVLVPRHDQPAALWRGHRLRIALLLLSVIGVTALLSITAVRDAFDEMLVAVAPLLSGHPFIGIALFVLSSALSSLLVFFSSAALVPAAVYAWGNPATIVLLWCGWLLGGMTTYAIGRVFRRPLVPTRRIAAALDAYLDTMPANLSWPLVFLLQLALPSEVPGYLCGFLRVRFRVYLSAVAVAEIPYAVGTVLLGESIVHARPVWFLVLGLAAVGLLGSAVCLLRARLRSETSAPHASAVAGEDAP